MNRKLTYLLPLLFFCVFSAMAQERATLRSLDEPSDTLDIESVLPANAPRKAFIYAALLPGMGQVYNEQYWKVPIVYGGFFGFGYLISFYNSRYQLYRTELFSVLADPGFTPSSGASESQLRTLIDRSRRERDYMMVLSAVYYMLQIVDAHVDAHLREFDLNPDLKLSLGPSVEPTITGGAFGVGITLKIQQ